MGSGGLKDQVGTRWERGMDGGRVERCRVGPLLLSYRPFSPTGLWEILGVP